MAAKMSKEERECRAAFARLEAAERNWQEFSRTP